MKPEIFNWLCGTCGKATPHYRYPDGPGQLPTSCSICGDRPFAMSEISQDSEAKTGMTGSKVLDAAVWALAVFFIGFLMLHTLPQLAWLRDLLFNDQI